MEDLPVINHENFFFGVVAGVGHMEGKTPREKVLQIEEDIKTYLETVDVKTLPTNHVFQDGLYIRQMFLPKGHLLTGKVHNFSDIFIVNAGDISLFSEFGFARVQAGFMSTSEAGVKRVGFAHEDTIMTTVNVCPYTTVEEAERYLFSKDYESFEAFKAA